MSSTEQTYRVQSIDELTPVVSDLSELSKEYAIFLLSGDLGAGKTTLVSKWMDHLGSLDQVSSPTFSLIQEYHTDTDTYYHMDMYRLNTLEEAINIGIEEYIYDTKSHCIIEWPELIMPLVDVPYVDIQITTKAEIREISWKVVTY